MRDDADGIFDAVKGYVERGIRPLLARLAGVEKRLDALPVPVNGKDGADGLPGKDGAPGIPGPRGADGVGVIGPVGPKGEDGKDGMPGRDGKDIAGRDGKDGVDGKDGATGPAGKDGDRGEKGEPGIAGKDGAPGITGKNGADGINGKDAADGVPGKDGDPGRDGRDGKAGPPGRDALQIEPLTGIDAKRSYPRGTYALEAGGMLRAVRTTEPFDGGKYEEAGWQVVWNGVRGGEFKMEPDGRTLTCALSFTVGQSVQKFHIPAQIYRGVWRDGATYQEGDTVTSGGSNWHANTVTTSRPGANDMWTLMTKRGSDGKDGR